MDTSIDLNVALDLSSDEEEELMTDDNGEVDDEGSNDTVAEAVISADAIHDPPESSSSCPRYPLRSNRL